MEPVTSDAVLGMLELVAPGRPLREGLDYIISARTGALVVIGDEEHVAELCNGGFAIDTTMTPQRLFELAKMDGAIVMDSSGRRILRANVHLVPDPGLPTSETGMRHRTAERVSRQTGALVVSVSQRRDVVTLYRGGVKIILEDVEVLLAKANQALQTLTGYRNRLDVIANHLTALEFLDSVTIGAVVAVIQRTGMLLRVARELGRYIAELGVEGRLVRMQSDQIMAGVESGLTMLFKDYCPTDRRTDVTAARTRLDSLSSEQLLDSLTVVDVLGLGHSTDILEQHVSPRGYRQLGQIPMLPSAVVVRLVERFGTLSNLLEAGEGQLDKVDGVGERRAHAIRESLAGIRERAAGA